MKTLRFNTMILCFFVVLSLLTSCSGYNARMRNHLCDEANYHSFLGTICDVYYFDAEDKKVSLLASDVIPNCDVVVELTFDDRDYLWMIISLHLTSQKRIIKSLQEMVSMTPLL